MIGLDRWTALAPRQREGEREREGGRGSVGVGCIEWGREEQWRGEEM